MKNTLLTNSFVVLTIIIISQILGIIFNIFFAHNFGTQISADAYILGMSLVITFFGFTNGLFLRPLMYMAERCNSKKLYGQAYLLSLIALPISLGVYFFASPISLMLLGKDESLLFRIIAPLFFLYALSSVNHSILHRRHAFFSSHLLRPLGLAGALSVVFLGGNIYNVATGYVIGTIFAVGITTALVIKSKGVQYTLTLDHRIAQTLVYAVPLCLASICYYGVRQIPLLLAANVGEGAIALLGYTTPFLYAIPLLVAEPVSTALFPHLSKSERFGDIGKISSMIIFTSVPIMLSLHYFGKPFFTMFYVQGQFSTENALLAAKTLSILALASIPVGLQSLFNSTLIATGRAWVYSVSLLIQVVIVMIPIFFSHTLKMIAFSIVIALWVGAIVQAVYLRVHISAQYKTLLCAIVFGVAANLFQTLEITTFTTLILYFILLNGIYILVAALLDHQAYTYYKNALKRLLMTWS